MDQNMKKLHTQLHVIELEYDMTKKGQGGEKINRENLKQLEELRAENQLLKQKI